MQPAVNIFWHCHAYWLLENIRYLHELIVERPMPVAGADDAVFCDTIHVCLGLVQTAWCLNFHDTNWFALMTAEKIYCQI